MAIIYKMSQLIWPYLEEHLKFLKSQRKHVPINDRSTRIGINISLILMSACCVEGRIEQELKELIMQRRSTINDIDVADFYKRRILNCFMSNIEDYLNSRVERTTGITNYDAFLDLLSYKRIPAKFKDYPNWEGVCILFNFRNVLAHARESSATRTQAWWTEGDWKDEFAGGYKSAEEYLLKKKLINKRFMEKGSIEHIFTNNVADHFVSLSKNFARFSRKLIDQEKKRFNISNIKGL